MLNVAGQLFVTFTAPIAQVFTGCHGLDAPRPILLVRHISPTAATR